MMFIQKSSLSTYRLTPACIRLSNAYSTDVAKKDIAAESSQDFFTEDETEKRVINLDRSRLLPQHRNLLHGKKPYAEPHSWIHLTEKYQRKLFGVYGAASDVSPRICFPTNEDSATQKRKQQFVEFRTLPEMMKIVATEEAQSKDTIKKRELEISKKLDKLEQWKSELRAKIAKREADTLAAIKQKERLIEEVRRHFGFKVDPRDEKFKELLEQKEKEYKKQQKEAKRKAKEEKMISKLAEKSSSAN